MNLTLSVDDSDVEKARRVAAQQGTSLNEMVRRFIASLAGKTSHADRAAEIVALFERTPGDSRGQTIKRDDAYQGRA